ncbi:hypothetical protein V1264_016392 [Littorina saxatilis]|uniref:Uncharacterized protein n=1 Tax=Littorina saxatilis TaxID=31220 RepID=A0AAN9GH50_9CAEN
MVLYTPGYKFFVVNNMAATLTCNWTDELGRALGQAYPLILSHAAAAEEHYTYLSVPPSDQLTVNRSFYSTSYTFTVIRSDHLTKFKCIAFVNTILEEKNLTIFIRSGPAIPILQGPSTVPKGDQGEWTCTSDCATHEFPEVRVSLSTQYDYWDQCPQCLEVTRDVYDDIYGVKTFKVVVKVSGMLPSGEPGDVFYLQCRSVYNPFPNSSQTLFSTPFSVNVSTANKLTTERIANTAIDTARTDTPDNDKKDDDDEKKPSGGISYVVLAWTIPLALLLVIVVAAIGICVQRHWSTRKTNIILSEAEIELNRIPSISDKVKHSERLGKKDVYTAPVSSSPGDQSDSQGHLSSGSLTSNEGRLSDSQGHLSSGSLTSNGGRLSDSQGHLSSGSLTSNGGRLNDDETTLDNTMSFV